MKLLLLAAALVALTVVPTASSKKPLKAAAVESFAVVGDPVFGGNVTFTYDEGTATPDWLFIYLECSQAGKVVLAEYGESLPLAQPAGESYPFVLGPTAWWTGGAADCSATLEGWSNQGQVSAIAATSFQAQG